MKGEEEEKEQEIGRPKDKKERTEDEGNKIMKGEQEE